MLSEIDLDGNGVKLSKEEWDEVKDDLEKQMGILQQLVREKKIPVIILFEGWGASGKGSMLAKLIEGLDPRAFSVHSIGLPDTHEQRFPWLHRFWKKLPVYGDIAIFDRSWYHEVFSLVAEGHLSAASCRERLHEAAIFEKQLTDDGYLLIKFFLHISPKEQKKRFESLESRDVTRWRVTKKDWRNNKRYPTLFSLWDGILTQSHTENAPWIVVPSTNRRFAANTILTTVAKRIEQQADAPVPPVFEGIRTSETIKPLPTIRLKDAALDCVMNKKTYSKELSDCQAKLSELHNILYLKKIPLILAYEGWDAAGKGGNIKRITKALDPRGYEVIPIAAPSTVEKNHPHLWRFWNALPKDGHIAIFDRTWYGRVLVEHVEGFCSDEQWGRAFDEINQFEQTLANWGAIILKFWLHIDKDEQFARFTKRQNIPEKQYKITAEDWRNREKWDQYEAATDEMLTRTNTEFAPWIVVESNDKNYARIKAMRTVIKALEERISR